MSKRNKETEDALDRHIPSEDNHSQSFTVGGAARHFVNLSLPDLPCLGKEAYKKQPYCVICFRNFKAILRQHHCRICVNAVCADCSRSMINKQRACDLCIMRYSNPVEERKKKEMLSTLETLCAFLIYRKKIKLDSGQGTDDLLKELNAQEAELKKLQEESSQLKARRGALEEELEAIREDNSQIQSSISQIEQALGKADFDSY